MDFGQKFFFVKLIYFISRFVFGQDFFNFSGPLCGLRRARLSLLRPPLLMYDNQYDTTTYYVFRKDLQKRVCEFLKKVPWPKFYSSKIDSRWTAPKKYLSLPRYCNLFSSLCQYQKLLILWIIYYLFFILSKWL